MQLKIIPKTFIANSFARKVPSTSILSAEIFCSRIVSAFCDANIMKYSLRSLYCCLFSRKNYCPLRIKISMLIYPVSFIVISEFFPSTSTSKMKLVLTVIFSEIIFLSNPVRSKFPNPPGTAVIFCSAPRYSTVLADEYNNCCMELGIAVCRAIAGLSQCRE